MYFLNIFPILFKGHVDLPCGHAQKKKKKKEAIAKQEGDRKKTNKQINKQ